MIEDKVVVIARKYDQFSCLTCLGLNDCRVRSRMISCITRTVSSDSDNMYLGGRRLAIGYRCPCGMGVVFEILEGE
jgi:hypothetical protein